KSASWSQDMKAPYSAEVLTGTGGAPSAAVVRPIGSTDRGAGVKETKGRPRAALSARASCCMVPGKKRANQLFRWEASREAQAGAVPRPGLVGGGHQGQRGRASGGRRQGDGVVGIAADVGVDDHARILPAAGEPWRRRLAPRPDPAAPASGKRKGAGGGRSGRASEAAFDASKPGVLRGTRLEGPCFLGAAGSEPRPYHSALPYDPG